MRGVITRMSDINITMCAYGAHFNWTQISHEGAQFMF